MKTASLFVAVSLALSVAAAQIQQDNRNNNNIFGGNRGGFGNNNNNGFFGQNNGRNGQNNQNNRGNNNNNQNNAGKNNQNNTGKNTGSTGKGATTTTAAAASTSAVAATTAAGATSTAASGNSTDAQSSLTLDPNVIATGFENDGQDVPTAGQVASLTSSNNFINFCLTVPNLPITNGKQITTGSCNPAPMGAIPSVDNMPSAKFTIPKNGDTLAANTPFTITMAVANFETGNFVNAQENYFAAPQQLNGQGQIIGHSHIVVESLTSLDQTTPTNPKVFAYFKGLNAAAVNGLLTADVTAGLPAGFYKVSSINTAANHQPVLVPIAQHGSLDDVSYFTVSDSGAAASAAPPAASASASAVATAATSAAPAKATTPAAGTGKNAPKPPVTQAPAPPAGKGRAPPQPAKRPTPPARVASSRGRRSFAQL
ncbi:hypothetical protein BDN70DRAFT_895519 [Pholiota conissans]|uniref:Uncharacterized protein n=1 Tax=Pholiota conissans TaxID=109636 RepID=A0A9P5Z0S7_9AGAR|nr:hypothetical protein BDN70DRAFT_895519 [Pholiota conissans]